MRGTLAAGIVSTLALAGCTPSITGEAVSTEGSSQATITSVPPAASPSRATASQLPFTTTVEGRTNERNDGSSFEPCTAYTAQELRALNIDPFSLADAAKSRSPNFRGCEWTSVKAGPSDRNYLNYSQIVGKRITLDDYKREQSFRPWQPDRIVMGRRLAVAPTKYDCTAAFISEAAVVITGTITPYPSSGLVRECDAAVAFATLAISKAP
ncbi:DUF3558 family protein [Tsukamurella strandjordii]|uniref:DUF3558 family protein n=1 Tax=Tsukamurella strandjordii TaxID=147577 RepID=A0AA90NQN7_9ACTN|nr:DUF3558 family protein [Tsukamurella strandjordii]MDP0398944.1 DUF3558 family protein [Tsukamurella strandjordii]